MILVQRVLKRIQLLRKKLKATWKKITMSGMYNVKSVEGAPPFQTEVHVNEIPVIFQIDTGAGVTIMNKSDFHLNFGEEPLNPTRTVLRSYTGDKIKVVGEKMVSVRLGEQHLDLPLIVVDEKGQSLLGSLTFCRGSRVESTRSRVESKKSRVESKKSRVEKKVESRKKNSKTNKQTLT